MTKGTKRDTIDANTVKDESWEEFFLRLGRQNSKAEAIPAIAKEVVAQVIKEIRAKSDFRI